jgi:hypothetical protein
MDFITNTAYWLLLNGLQRLKQHGDLGAGNCNFLYQEINGLNLEEFYWIGGHPIIWTKVAKKMSEISPY